MRNILLAMLIDPVFALIAMGQFISYIGLTIIVFLVCKRVLKK